MLTRRCVDIHIYTREILIRFIHREAPANRLYLPGQPRPAFPPMEQQSAFYIRVSTTSGGGEDRTVA